MTKHPKALPAAKQAEAKAVAERLAAALAFRELGVVGLAKLTRKSRNTVASHVRPKAWSRPVSPKTRRIYERVLRLPALSLDSGTPQQLIGMLQNVPQRVSEPYQAPFSGPSDDLEGTLTFIRSQLAGYAARGRLVPVAVVVSWLSELDAAITAATASPGPDIAGSESGLPITARPRQAGAAP